MYRHLLVPIDDSLLSTDIVRQAVLFAKALGARPRSSMPGKTTVPAVWRRSNGSSGRGLQRADGRRGGRNPGQGDGRRA